jgi:hypothetical protein
MVLHIKNRTLFLDIFDPHGLIPEACAGHTDLILCHLKRWKKQMP